MLEQAEGVLRVCVLAEDDHARVGMRGVEPVRDADALDAVRRRHADVGEDDVRPLLVDRAEELVVV